MLVRPLQNDCLDASNALPNEQIERFRLKCETEVSEAHFSRICIRGLMDWQFASGVRHLGSGLLFFDQVEQEENKFNEVDDVERLSSVFKTQDYACSSTCLS